MPNRVGVLPAFPASTIPAAPSQNILLRQGAESGDLTGMTATGVPVAVTTAPASGGWCYSLPVATDVLIGSVGASKTNMRISFRHKPITFSPTNILCSYSPNALYFRLDTLAGGAIRVSAVGTDAVTYTGNQTAGNPLITGAWNDFVISIKTGVSIRVWLNGVLAITLDLTAVTLQPWVSMAWRGVNAAVDDIVISSDPNDASIDGMRITSNTSGQGVLAAYGAENGSLSEMATIGAPLVTMAERASGAWSYSVPAAGDYIYPAFAPAAAPLNSMRFSFRIKMSVAPNGGQNFFGASLLSFNSLRVWNSTGDITKLSMSMVGLDSFTYTVNQSTTGTFVWNQWNDIVISIQNKVNARIWCNGALATTLDLTPFQVTPFYAALFRGPTSFYDDLIISSDPLDASIDGMRLGGLPEALLVGGRARHDLFRARRNGLLLPKRAAGIIVPPVVIPVNTSAPVVSPTTNLYPGNTLTCSSGGWNNAPSSYTYQWKRAGVNISGATNLTYVLVTADIANAITCAVVASNVAGSSTAALSNATSAVNAPTVAPVNTVAPVVSPATNVQTGTLLTTTNGTWSNTPTGYTYQWQANSVNISGATSATFTPTATQIGAAMRCVVTASNAGGSNSANSNATNTIAAPLAPPVNSVAPIVTGATTVSMLLTSGNGTWSNSPTGYTYQWYNGTAPIAGATVNAYRLTMNEVGGDITCRVRATNADGFADADSNATACIRGWQPQDLPGAYAWYDMGDPLMMTPSTGLEGDQITNLADKLGNPGRNMPVVSASTPTLKLNKLNGLPGLQMSTAGDAADARLYNPSMPLGAAALTVYVLAAVPSAFTNSAARVVSFAPAALADTDATATRISRVTTTTQMALVSGGATKFSAIAETAFTVDVPFQLAFNWDNANCYVEREGSAPIVSAQVAARNIARVALGCGILASGTGLSGVSWRGLIYEVMISSIVNTLADRQKMTGWQAWRWGRQSLLPAGHPWKNSPPVPPAGPAAITAPVVSGGRTLNMLLTASPGTYASTPETTTYQWYRNGAAVAGATAATYRLGAADVDTTLRCTVRVTGLGGETFSNSNDTACVRGWQPDDAPSPHIWWSADDPTKMTPSTGAEGAQITAIANKFAGTVTAGATVASTLKNNIQAGLPGLYGFSSGAAVSKLNVALSGIDTSSFTVYAVAKSLTAASALSNMRLVSMARTGFADTATTSFRIAKQGNTQALAVTISNAVHAAMPYVLDQTFQIAVGVDDAAITAEMDGGADVADAVTSTLNVQTLGWACQVINGDVGVDSLAWNGNAYDLLIYKAAHDLATRQKMAGWLAWRWGLEAQLPAGHPYKQEPPGLAVTVVNPSGLPFKSGHFGGATRAQWASFRGCTTDCTLTFPGQNVNNYTSGGWTGPYSSWITNDFVNDDFTDALASVPYVVVTMPLMNYTDRQQFASIASRSSGDELFTTHTALANHMKSLMGTSVIGLRLGHEANATNILPTTDPLGSKGRYPWTYINPEGGAYAVPADYRAAWARVAAIYKTILGPQVKLIWNQVWQKNNEQRYTDYYPGDDYVDVLGYDTYDNGSSNLPINSDANWNVLLGYYNATTGRGKGLLGCLDFAKSRGKKMSVEEWAPLNGDEDPANPVNNSVFPAKMKGFFDANAAWIDHENYFNLGDSGHTIYPLPALYLPLSSAAYQAAYP